MSYAVSGASLPRYNSVEIQNALNQQVKNGQGFGEGVLYIREIGSEDEVWVWTSRAGHQRVTFEAKNFRFTYKPDSPIAIGDWADASQQTITIGTNLDYVAGERIEISYDHNNYWIAETDSYDKDSGSIVFTVTEGIAEGTDSFSIFTFDLYNPVVRNENVLSVKTIQANYTALSNQTIFTPADGDFAVVTSAQGTKYLPGNLGGNFYPAGLYIFNSSDNAWNFLSGSLTEGVYTAVQNQPPIQTITSTGVGVAENAMAYIPSTTKVYFNVSGAVIDGVTTDTDFTDTSNWTELSLGTGTTVVANPSGTDGEDLTRMTIGSSNYNLASGGGDQFADQQALEDFITNKGDFRTDIGAGTSSLILGTTSTTALAGNTEVDDVSKANLQTALPLIDDDTIPYDKVNVAAEDIETSKIEGIASGNDATTFLNATGTYTTPAGNGGISDPANEDLDDGVTKDFIRRATGQSDNIDTHAWAEVVKFQTRATGGTLTNADSITFANNFAFAAGSGANTLDLAPTIDGNRNFDLASTPQFMIRENDNTNIISIMNDDNSIATISMEAPTDFTNASVLMTNLGGLAAADGQALGVDAAGLITRIAAGGGDSFDGVFDTFDGLFRDDVVTSGDTAREIAYQALNDNATPEQFDHFKIKGWINSVTDGSEDGGGFISNIVSGTAEDIIAINTSQKTFDDFNTIDPQGVLDIRTVKEHLNIIFNDLGMYMEENTNNKIGFFTDATDGLSKPREQSWLRAGNVSLENKASSNADDYRVASYETGFFGSKSDEETLMKITARTSSLQDDDGYLNGTVGAEIRLVAEGFDSNNIDGSIEFYAPTNADGEVDVNDLSLTVKNDEVLAHNNFRIDTASDPLLIIRSRETAADGNEAGRISFEAQALGGNTELAEIIAGVEDSSTLDGQIDIRVRNTSTMQSVFFADAENGITLAQTATGTPGYLAIDATGGISVGSGGSGIPEPANEDLPDGTTKTFVRRATGQSDNIDTYDWIESAGSTVEFGDQGGEVATWAEGDNTGNIPYDRVNDTYESQDFTISGVYSNIPGVANETVRIHLDPNFISHTFGSLFTFDPDTADTVYTSSVPSTNTGANLDATATLEAIADVIVALETGFSKSAVGDAISGLQKTLSDDDQYDGTSNFIVNGQWTLSTTSTSITRPTVTTSSVISDFVDTYIVFGAATDLGFAEVVSGSAVSLTIGGCTADVIVGVTDFVSGTDRGWTITSVTNETGTFGDTTPGLTIIGGMSKFIDIDLNTTTNIAQAMTLTLGTNVIFSLQSLFDGGDLGAAVSSNIVVSDYSGTEVSSFTNTSTSETDDQTDTIGSAIASAINANAETPVDFTATWDNSTKVVSIIGDPGVIDGSWSITIDHSGADAASQGDIAITAGSVVENNIKSSDQLEIADDTLPTLDVYNTNNAISSGDTTGNIDFLAKNADGEKVLVSRFSSVLDDNTAGAENASIVLSKMVDGVLTDVEVGFNGTLTDTNLILEDATSTGTGTSLSVLEFSGLDGASNPDQFIYGAIHSDVTNRTSGSEAGRLDFFTAFEANEADGDDNDRSLRLERNKAEFGNGAIIGDVDDAQNAYFLELANTSIGDLVHYQVGQNNIQYFKDNRAVAADQITNKSVLFTATHSSSFLDDSNENSGNALDQMGIRVEHEFDTNDAWGTYIVSPRKIDRATDSGTVHDTFKVSPNKVEVFVDANSNTDGTVALNVEEGNNWMLTFSEIIISGSAAIADDKGNTTNDGTDTTVRTYVGYYYLDGNTYYRVRRNKTSDTDATGPWGDGTNLYSEQIWSTSNNDTRKIVANRL